MTRRRSRREIEAALADLPGGRRDSATYPELVEYLASLGDDPEAAPLPTERYTDTIVEELDAPLPFDAEDLPGDLAPEDFTGLERYGLAYLGEDIRRGILRFRLARGGSR